MGLVGGAARKRRRQGLGVSRTFCASPTKSSLRYRLEIKAEIHEVVNGGTTRADAQLHFCLRIFQFDIDERFNRDMAASVDKCHRNGRLKPRARDAIAINDLAWFSFTSFARAA
jgi:hypothetical protein